MRSLPISIMTIKSKSVPRDIAKCTVITYADTQYSGLSTQQIWIIITNKKRFRQKIDIYVHSGRVQEMYISVCKLPSSSSARARYLWSPVWLRIFLASRVKMIVDRVSFMKMITKINTNPVMLKRLISLWPQKTEDNNKHHMYPLNPGPLEACIHLDPSSGDRSNPSSSDSR